MTATAAPAIDRSAINSYFSALWPDAEAVNGDVVIAAFKGGRKNFRWSSVADAPKAVLALGVARDLYVTVQAHDKTASARTWLERHPGENHPEDRDHRGCSESAVAIPGAWVDFDCAGGVHRAANLPTKERALAYLES